MSLGGTKGWALALVGLLLAACTSRAQLSSELVQAAAVSDMPEVRACWESHFERAGFRGSYVATVSFVLASDGSLRDVEVTTLEPDDRDGSAMEPTGELSACLRVALEATVLDDIRPSNDVAVTAFRIALRDGSAQARLQASEQAATILIGPRADRCHGLYGHEPPRDLAQVQRELSHAQNLAAVHRGTDRDRYARALQQSYDLALELRQRLLLESKRKDLPQQGRSRMRSELRRSTEIARELGAQIGCDAPSL